MKNSQLILFINLLLCNYLSGQLEKGDDCLLENGKTGMCKLLNECPSKLEEVKQGKRSATSFRCGFEGRNEVVCCPINITINIPQKVGIRPAELACHEHENEISTSSERLLPHVLAGIEVQAGEFPYMVALGYNEKDESDVNKTKIKYSCGGTLIASRYVLTAAHCVSNFDNLVPVLVRAGSVDLELDDENAREIPISEVIPHEDFSRVTLTNDIALLKLSQQVEWSARIKPICLSTKAVNLTQNFSSTEFVVTGWGLTKFDGETSRTLLKTPSLKLIGHNECVKPYEMFKQVADKFDERIICAVDSNTTRGSDACQGDSGGPLLMLTVSEKDILIGVTSFGQSCGDPVPGVYTSVYPFLNWIEEIVWPDQNLSEKKN